MSIFQIPKEIVSDIECAMNAFWWGAKYGSRKGIRWKSLSQLCVPKDWGGIGFRRLDLFNTVFLCKQAWRLIQFPSSLVARVFQAKYYPVSSFLDARRSSNPSFIWNSLSSTKEIIRQHSRWRIGNGNSINIWRDRWLPDSSNPKISTPYFSFMEIFDVSSLFIDQSLKWDVDIIQNIFNHRYATLITNIPLPLINSEDKLIWMREDRGQFMVKSCYRALLGEKNVVNRKDWATIWKCNVPPKVSHVIDYPVGDWFLKNSRLLNKSQNNLLLMI
ncbi:uncharacterized protein LOC116016097 [Ipomoea triloba]|uniref:uncharacterized protein LOC116016097 n=1 Tax=Ipomoea triloba TaxID=35885 RepID=UPI00125D6B66|nr:uncharacterized protein LOC116016097 [Ipomoea triloba]